MLNYELIIYTFPFSFFFYYYYYFFFQDKQHGALALTSFKITKKDKKRKGKQRKKWGSMVKYRVTIYSCEHLRIHDRLIFNANTVQRRFSQLLK